MGTGMGIPSISIYARVVDSHYVVKRVIRVGTAGSLNEDIHVRELVLAQAAATIKHHPQRLAQYDFHQIASFTIF